MDLPSRLQTSLAPATHNRLPPPPPEPAAQSAVNKLAAQAQQMADLESENSALQKMLIQQTEKYDHDMNIITQVCTFAPGINFSLVYVVYCCTHTILFPL